MSRRTSASLAATDSGEVPVLSIIASGMSSSQTYSRSTAPVAPSCSAKRWPCSSKM
jgi:hypothetical protein